VKGGLVAARTDYRRYILCEWEYQFSVEVIDSEFGIESNSKTVTADCTAEDTKVGGSWSVRLHPGGGVTVCDNNIC
jgi:hypothetical protein